MGKKYLDRVCVRSLLDAGQPTTSRLLQRARRFFTISTDVVQFWILQSNKLDTLHSIRIDGGCARRRRLSLSAELNLHWPGLREAGLCQQCTEANLLVVCPSQFPHSESRALVFPQPRVHFAAEKSEAFAQGKQHGAAARPRPRHLGPQAAPTWPS